MLSYCTVLQLHTSQAKKGYKISEVTAAEVTATQNPGIYNNNNKRYAQQEKTRLTFREESAMTHLNTDKLLKFLFWQATALQKD